MNSDVLVLGAGMVGVSAALQILKRGRSVTLVDRRGTAEETSFGNAGLIQREGVVPYAFPHDFGKILSYALNNRTDARYQPLALPWIAMSLYRYWRWSTPDGIAATARAARPLVERSLSEHEALMQEAGIIAMLRRTGYLKFFRTAQAYEKAITEEAQDRERYGVTFEAIDGNAIRNLEPHFLANAAGAILMPQPASVADPSAVARAYAELFIKLGGRIMRGEARTLQQTATGWSVATSQGALEARDAVIALGPWSPDVYRPLGYRLPMFFKRGYHMTFAPSGNATLARPLLDAESGFVLTPMSRGIRMTTGVEFGRRDTPPTPVQVGRDEPIARATFPLGERVDKEPWLGRRPSFPDMLPVIGPAPRHRGLWFDFGHHHLGFTLGPVTGQLLADLVTGVPPFTDPTPYSATRFS